VIHSIPITSREQWLEMRKQDVTASVVAALSGLHPWVSKLSLYKQKCGLDVPVKMNVRMRRGLRIERAVAAMVMEDYPSWNVTPAGVYLRDPDLRLGATPDFFVETPDEIGLGVLQTKTTMYHTFRQSWMDDEGALMVPPFILLQTTTEMMMSNAYWGAVACFIDDGRNPMEQDLFLFRLDRHAKGEAKIRADVAQFWRDIADGIEPDVDPTLDSELVKLLYPGSDDLITADLSGDNYLPGALAARAAAKARIAEDQAFCEEVETYLRGKMGAAELAFLNGFTVTLKTVNKKAYSVPASSYRKLHVKDVRPKEEIADGEQIEF
jgi:predicted phage-related endonuclease